MLTIKEKYAFKVLSRRYLKIFMNVLIGLLAFSIVRSAFMLLLWVNTDEPFSFGGFFTGLFIQDYFSVLMFVLFILTFLNYRDFKYFMQNSLSRNTYWKAKTLVILVFGFCLEVLDLVFTEISQLLGITSYDLVNVFQNFYMTGVKSKVLLQLGSFGFSLLILWGFCFIGFTIGSLFSMLARKKQLVLIAVFVIIGLQALLLLLGFLLDYDGRLQDFILLFLGYSEKGSWDSTLLLSFSVCSILVNMLLSHYFITKIQVKRR